MYDKITNYFPPEEPEKPPPKKEEKDDKQDVKKCFAYLKDHQKGKNYDCHDNGRARDAGNSQECIDKVLSKSKPFGKKKVKVTHNWGPDGHCK